MAPEVVRREPYDEKADVWSLGVLLFEMLHGHAPFRGWRDQDTLSKILESKIVFDEDVKQDAAALINLILDQDPQTRPTVVELLNQPWTRRMQSELGHALPTKLYLPLYNRILRRPLPKFPTSKQQAEGQEGVKRSPEQQARPHVASDCEELKEPSLGSDTGKSRRRNRRTGERSAGRDPARTALRVSWG